MDISLRTTCLSLGPLYSTMSARILSLYVSLIASFFMWSLRKSLSPEISSISAKLSMVIAGFFLNSLD